jgi:hypothetical protein
MKYIITLLSVFAFFIAAAECDDMRYKEEITTETVTHDSIIFGNNIDSRNQPMDLLMTVYEPQEANIPELRPLIIFVHGGSFVNGDRMSDDVNYPAQLFARKGYVTATIEYRLEQPGFTIPVPDLDFLQSGVPFIDFADKNNWYKAMIRAVHDIRASIRYFKKDVTENGNAYNIDTNRIILYGSSAGAIAALHTVFIDNLDEASVPFKINFDTLGGFEGNSGNSGYTSIGVKAIVSSSGAVDRLDYLDNNTDIAYIAFHHTIDFTVPFDKGYFITVARNLGIFYGDNQIAQQCKRLGMKYEFYPIPKIGHPADDYEDIETHNMVMEKTTNFLYNQLICNDRLTPIVQTQTQAFNVYPNPNSGFITIDNDAALYHQECTLQVINQMGVTVKEEKFVADRSNRFVLDIANGLYILKISNDKDNSTQYISRVLVVK